MAEPNGSGDASSAERARRAVRDAIWQDINAKRLRLLEAYLAQFPDVPDVVRDEYAAALAALQDSAAGAERGDGPSTDDGAGAGAEGPRLADPYVGRRLGPWKLLRELGRGAQGAVYLAQDERLHRKAAVKVLTATGLLGDALDRFKREAAVTSRLDHPGICAVYDVGLEGRTPYIAMRCVEGESLAQRIGATKARAEGDASLSHVELPGTDAVDAEPPPSPPAKAAAAPSRPSTRRKADPHAPSTQLELMKIVRLVEQAARAVHAAHEAGVIHRDLKPGNIMVTTEGEPVVLDFGLAKDISGVEATLTQHGDLMGTPAYMSPEQIAAHRITLDRRTDVYSLGVTLFECLTLQRPFDAPTREGLYQAILGRPAPDPRRLNRAIPGDLKVVLETALDKDRERRYATALDFAEDLRRVRCFEPIAARPASAWTKLLRWARRSPALAATTAVGVVLFAVSVFLLVQTSTLLDRATEERNAKQSALTEKADALADFERLAVVPRLQALEAERETVWPLTAKNHLPRKEWLDRAERLASELPQLEDALARLRATATAVETPEPEVQSGATVPPGVGDLTLGALGPPAEPESQPTTRSAPRKWRLLNPAAQFKHDVLAAFVEDLRQFATANSRHRELVGMRLQDAESDRFLALLNCEHRPLWEAASASIRDSIACPFYRGLDIAPQFGLVPIGRNPWTRLWEFMDLGTCAWDQPLRPERRADGTLEYLAGHGVVFVLLPGGDAVIGSRVATEAETRAKRRGEATSPEIDWDATGDESPQHVVPLAPFFLSKYELTQRQWEHLTGVNPSRFFENGAQRPVECVNSYACARWTYFAAMRLPTEAQWEYGCRAGTTTPWGTGAIEAHPKSAFERLGGLPKEGTTTVGNSRANEFGLHNMYENVGEWCRDAYGQYKDRPARPGDGLRGVTSWVQLLVYRGKTLFPTDKAPRSASREFIIPEYRSIEIGVRPSRCLDP
jgi:serine/threonine protein kinase/formylglycine-generating enzyme required for sulfatase activity